VKSDVRGSHHRGKGRAENAVPLAVLSQKAAQRPECLADEREAAVLQALIARRRRKIQHKAIELAQRIFVAKPQKLARPIRQARVDTPTSTASPAS
jgi:hypothetical protein